MARRLFSIQRELLTKSREAVLSAIQVYNNPLVTFKSESFIVLMIIGWTYLMHAFYRSQGVDYRYFKQGQRRRTFQRTKSGAFRYWDLDTCLQQPMCPLTAAVKNNLRFLLVLRHEIEHQMSLRLDGYLSGRYMACAVNYNGTIQTMFGESYGVDQHLGIAIQFLELSRDQVRGVPEAHTVPDRMRAFIASFDEALSDEEYQSQAFSYRMVFKRRIGHNINQADSVIDFIKDDDPRAENIDKQYWVKQETERPKLLAGEVVDRIRKEGYPRFGIPDHTMLWKSLNAKEPNQGYGVKLGVSFFWYERWLDVCRAHAAEHAGEYR